MGNRLRAFLHRLLSDLKWTGELPEKLRRIMAELISLATLLGYATSWTAHVPHWLRYLIWPTVVYVTWKMAIAWHETRGPSIWISDPIPDGNARTYNIEVQNRGSGSYVAHVYAVKLDDEKDQRLPRINDQLELHWRGSQVGQPMKLYLDKHGLAEILRCDHFGAVPMPGLTVMRGDPPDLQTVDLYTDEQPTPGFKQKELRLTIRVDFVDDKGECVAAENRRFAILPDFASPMLYRVNAI